MEGDVLDGQVEITLDFEVYLKGRRDTVLLEARVPVWASLVVGGLTVEMILSEAEDFLLQELDTKGALRLVLRSSRGARHVVIIDEIQIVNILVPDQDTVDQLIVDAHTALGRDDEQLD